MFCVTSQIEVSQKTSEKSHCLCVQLTSSETWNDREISRMTVRKRGASLACGTTLLGFHIFSFTSKQIGNRVAVAIRFNRLCHAFADHSQARYYTVQWIFRNATILRQLLVIFHCRRSVKCAPLLKKIQCENHHWNAIVRVPWSVLASISSHCNSFDK